MNKVMRYLTGPTREEMGMPPKSEVEVPHFISQPIPYKPGTEKAQGLIGATQKTSVVCYAIMSWPVLALVVGLVISLVN